VIISSATEADLGEVSDVHVKVWRQAYAGQMPRDFLDSLDAGARLQGWREGFMNNANDPRFGLLLARKAGALAGFLAHGPARDADRDGWLEIYAINVLKEHWSSGIGHGLFRAACARLKDLGARRTYLWVLDTNANALAAYARWGGTPEPERLKTSEIGGAPLTEISVTFDSL
jgi:GNAT superfamily N-acetyltransferase